MSSRTMKVTKFPHWTAWCEVHGQIEADQPDAPTRCHVPVRIGKCCGRKLQRVVSVSGKKWADELERSAG